MLCPLVRPPPAPSPPCLTQSLSTDALGHASARINLGALPAANATVDGDTVHIHAQWVGPTGELIQKDGSVQ